MKYRATLSRSTTDMVKSKCISLEYAQITLDVYMTPEEFAALMRKFYESEFQVEFKKE